MSLAITTTLDDNYFKGFLLTFGSILKTTKNFNHDLVILEWGYLGEHNKKIISKLYNKVVYKKVDVEAYRKHVFDDTFRKWNYNCNYRFDIFELTQYERVLFFDCDFIFEIDINEILDYEVDFGACLMSSYTEYAQVSGSKIFNGGLMSVGKKFLNSKTKEDLIKIANTPPPRKYGFLNWVGNQPILNNYFLPMMDFLPERFNFLTEAITKDTFSEPKNYHFIGKRKPWHGNEFSEQFDKYILNEIKTRNYNLILYKMVLKKLIEKYQNIVEFLLEKNINIENYE
jgi:lipopolysaccharide biosynthesis glycosyltransferase